MEKRLLSFLLANTCYVLLQVVTGVKFFEILLSFPSLFVMLNQTKHIGFELLQPFICTHIYSKGNNQS